MLPREKDWEQRTNYKGSEVGRFLECSQEKPKKQEENQESHVLEAK